jgi:DNA invertase Pin-like site-specific DNA recombinase
MKAKYVRVSSEGQSNLRQIDFDGKIYADVCSGSIAFNERPEASKLLSNKDVTELHVHSIDRLGRNTLNIMQTIQYFTSNGVNVISEKEGLQTLINGKENPIAKMMIGILGTLAEFELSRIKERQAEGIKKAKEKSVYIGRKTGSSESVDKFISKESTQNILKYLKQKESIKRAALLSKTSEGKVKKVKKMIRDGLITF